MPNHRSPYSLKQDLQAKQCLSDTDSIQNQIDWVHFILQIYSRSSTKSSNVEYNLTNGQVRTFILQFVNHMGN